MKNISTKQYAYTIDNIGRVHIKVDNNLISGLIIDDNSDFFYDKVKYPIIEDDFIIKVGIELIKYSTNKIESLTTIPIYINLTEFSSNFYDQVISIPYGETMELTELVTSGQLPHARKLINNCELQIAIPIHRVIDSKINKDLNYYLEKLRLLESNHKN